jgi:hypothetical protein
MHVDWMEIVGPSLMGTAALLRGWGGNQPIGSFMAAALMPLAVMLSLSGDERGAMVVALAGAALLTALVVSSLVWKAKRGDTRFGVRQVLRVVLPLSIVAIVLTLGIASGSFPIRATSWCLFAIFMVGVFRMGIRNGAPPNGQQ